MPKLESAPQPTESIIMRVHVVLKTGINTDSNAAEIIAVGNITNVNDDRIRQLGIITGDMQPEFLRDVQALQQVEMVTVDGGSHANVDPIEMTWGHFKQMCKETTINLKTMTDAKQQVVWQEESLPMLRALREEVNRTLQWLVKI